MAEAGLSLGSNLGDRTDAILAALRLLHANADVKIIARSHLYQTAPWGDENQDAFLNACVVVKTSLKPMELLDLCLDVERRLGRDRSTGRRWGPRRIDIDILFYDQISQSDETLTLPHPRMFERAFVLVPLSEIAHGHSVNGRNIGDAADALDRSGVDLWD
jgi:2-amino-4-hydroxy-6-hydroxymethyldihydropteridine diphosphokinase